MIKSYTKLLCAILLTAPAIFASQPDQGLQQFYPDDIRFAAAEKWSDEKALLVGGAIGGGIGGVCGLRGGLEPALACAAIGAVIGGGFEYWNNGRYTKAYDAADGKTIHGAAAANNARGVQAWVNYGPSNSAIARDNDNMTPLMYAAANGAYEAVKMVGDLMPAEYEVTESETETESVIREKGLAKSWEDILLPETVKSKSVKKKKVKSADMQDITGQTAFHWALDGNHFKVVAYLLMRGKANGNIEDNRGRSVKNMTIHGKSVNDYLDEVRKQGLARVR